MAKYAISQEGIEALEQLASDLQKCTEELDAASYKLHNVVEGNSEELGIYFGGIMEVLQRVLEINKYGKESVQQIVKADIPDRIFRIEELIAMFAEMDSDSDGDVVTQKILSM